MFFVKTQKPFPRDDVSCDSVFGQWDAYRRLLALQLLLSANQLLLRAAVLQEHCSQVAQPGAL